MSLYFIRNYSFGTYCINCQPASAAAFTSVSPYASYKFASHANTPSILADLFCVLALWRIHVLNWIQNTIVYTKTYCTCIKYICKQPSLACLTLPTWHFLPALHSNYFLTTYILPDLLLIITSCLFIDSLESPWTLAKLPTLTANTLCYWLHAKQFNNSIDQCSLSNKSCHI